MPVIVKCYGPASGPDLIDGEYLLAYDIEAHDGRGDARFTTKVKEALQFPDMEAAVKFTRQTSQLRPLRADGKPNRPLTAFHMEYITS